MIAHLQNGEYHGNRILSAETAEMMHNSPLTLLPPLNRMELGFFETNINGREVIAHLGDTRLFSHIAAFVPQGGRRLLRLLQQRRQGRRGRQPAHRAVRRFRRPLFPRGRSRRRRSMQRPPPRTRPCWRDTGSIRAARSRISCLPSACSAKPRWALAKGELVVPFKGLNGSRGTGSRWRRSCGRIGMVTSAWRPRWWTARSCASASTAIAVHGVRPRALVSGCGLAAALLYAPWRAWLLTALFWPVAAIVRRRFGARLALGPGAPCAPIAEQGRGDLDARRHWACGHSRSSACSTTSTT